MNPAKILFVQFILLSFTVTIMADQNGELPEAEITAPVSNYQKIHKDMELLLNKKLFLNAQIDERLYKIKKLNCENIEIEIWIEVQRNLSYTRQYFLDRTKKSYDHIAKNKILIKNINSELRELYKYHEETTAELKSRRKQYRFLIESSDDINFQTVFYNRN